MKINIVLIIISAVIAGLLAFGFYALNAGDQYRILVTVGCALTLFLSLSGILVLSSARPGLANIRVVSGLFFVVFLILHIIFNFTGVFLTPYFIITGILLALYVMLCYLIIRVLAKTKA